MRERVVRRVPHHPLFSPFRRPSSRRRRSHSRCRCPRTGLSAQRPSLPVNTGSMSVPSKRCIIEVCSHSSGDISDMRVDTSEETDSQRSRVAKTRLSSRPGKVPRPGAYLEFGSSFSASALPERTSLLATLNSYLQFHPAVEPGKQIQLPV